MKVKRRASEKERKSEGEKERGAGRERVPTGSSLGSCNWKCNFDAEYTRKSPRKLKERLQPRELLRVAFTLGERQRRRRRWRLLLLLGSQWKTPPFSPHRGITGRGGRQEAIR